MQWGRLLSLILVTLALLGALGASVAEADEPGPLAIVFDTSGSMAEEDSSGAVKLKTAQASLNRLVVNQSPGIDMGLWTYPGGESGSDGCQPGGWFPQLAPDESPDPTDVNAQIRLLAADGETPTGPALKQVAASLRDKGYTAGTIVLVSDGESNCGPPPCEVAEEIVASGFDITVAAVAFDIEGEGGAELKCIADVTEGSYTEAKDSDALLESLAQYQKAQLELDVRAPEKIQSGATAQFAVRVTNPSNQVVSNLIMSMTLKSEPEKLIPYLPHPQLRLPALEPGASMTRTWLAGSSGKFTGTADWKVIVGSDDSGAVMNEGALEVVEEDLQRRDGGALLKSAGGVAVVFGDSYSSGEGAGSYAGAGRECHRSQRAYGAVVGGSDTTMIACSGAVTANMLNRPQNGFDPQFTQLEEMGAVPDIGFLTIGGNDVGFSTILQNCFVGDCAGNVSTYLSNVMGQANQLAKVYAGLAERLNTPKLVKARDGHIAPLVVSAYPDLFWSAERGTCNAVFRSNEILAAQAILSELNKQVEAGVASARMKGWPVYYADSVVDFALNHSMCVADSYFVRVNIPAVASRKVIDYSLMTRLNQEMGHPTGRGHRAWANALILWSQSTRAEPIDELPRDEGVQNALHKFGRLITERAISTIRSTTVTQTVTVESPNDDGTFKRTETTVEVDSGTTVVIEADDLAPGSTVTIGVRSQPTTLGSFRADENGQLQAAVTFPPDMALGGHTLTVWGLDGQGNLAGATMPLQVRPSVPVWLGVAAGVSLLSLLLAITFSLFRARMNRRLRTP